MENSLYLGGKVDSRARAESDPVYRAVAEEMKTLKSSFDNPSGKWTLIQDKSAATGSLNVKLK